MIEEGPRTRRGLAEARRGMAFALLLALIGFGLGMLVCERAHGQEPGGETFERDETPWSPEAQTCERPAAARLHGWSGRRRGVVAVQPTGQASVATIDSWRVTVSRRRSRAFTVADSYPPNLYVWRLRRGPDVRIAASWTEDRSHYQRRRVGFRVIVGEDGVPFRLPVYEQRRVEVHCERTAGIAVNASRRYQAVRR